VEDLISAHKVGMVGFECIPLFGTHVHNPVIYHLLTANKDVVLWLDKDQAFNVKRQALRLASIVPQDIRIINTDKDPKCLSFDTIKEYVSA
jgi:DNA primase